MEQSLIKKIEIALFFLAIIAVIVLGVLVHYRNVLGTDLFLSRDLQAGGSSQGTRTAIYYFLYFISVFGKPVIATICVLLATFGFWLTKNYREAIFVIFSSFAVVVNYLVKLLVNRPRPTQNLVQIFAKENDPSFPSGHVVFYVVFFGFLMIALSKSKNIPACYHLVIKILSTILIVFVSFSRIYLGVHWATDTIGGYLLGAVLLTVLTYFYLNKRYLKNIN
jgi:undecaprenyl-diphosphatase